MTQQLRLVDLVPKRYQTYIALFAAGVACVAVLEALHKCLPMLAPMTTDGRVATFDLEGEGSLAVWFSCATLELAALAALAAWAIRRRTPGRKSPHVLLVAAACWLVMSIDECAGLHEGFKELMSHGTGHRLHGDGTIWWVIAYCLVLSAIGWRLLGELRRAPAAVVALAATGGFYALAVAAELAWIIPNKGEAEVMLEEGCEMIGNLCLLLSMGFYARSAAMAAAAQENEGPVTLPVSRPAAAPARAA
jgi:hypothetical protein